MKNINQLNEDCIYAHSPIFFVLKMDKLLFRMITPSISLLVSDKQSSIQVVMPRRINELEDFFCVKSALKISAIETEKKSKNA